MKNKLNGAYPDLKEIIVTEKVKDNNINEIINELKDVDLTLVSILVRIRMNKGIATIDDSYASLIKRLYQNGIPFIVTSFGSPYLPTYDYIDTYLAAYGYGSVLVEAAANALLTDVPITGRLPVELNKELKRGDQILVHRDSAFLEKANISYSLSIIDSAVEAKIFPGAQVYISQHGKTILSKGFGYHTY